MAKRNKMLPARKQRDRSRDDESLLMRSAESLGRMIGSLQRQLDGAGKRLSEKADDFVEHLPDIPPAGGRDVARRSGAKRKRKKTAGTKKNGNAEAHRTQERRAPAEHAKRPIVPERQDDQQLQEALVPIVIRE